MIVAKVIADSKNEFGNRITTMIVTFPRIILAELNTHRMLSRNSASSRAIPFEKMVKSVQDNPFIPMAWQKDHKGMQGTEYFDNNICDIDSLKEQWLEQRNAAIYHAQNLHSIGVTKQLCNRLLEPFMWHTVIITATEWENFFELRCPKYLGDDGLFYNSRKECEYYSKLYIGYNSENLTFNWNERNKGQSEIHMMALAEAMWDVYQNSIPLQLKENQWHIPFIEVIED